MITVVGSINLDIVATGPALPRPGETVGGARLARHPGGKGANQALAARRLGADVQLVGAVGADDMADEALNLLQAGGVDLVQVAHVNGETTGVALIAVDAGSGENLIVVCPGANNVLRPDDVAHLPITHMMGVLEVPVPALLAAAQKATGFVSLNLAPALPVPDALLAEADLICVNETEAEAYGDQLNASGAYVAVSLGAQGAVLYKAGEEIARAAPPKVQVVDTVGAGDTFTAALTVALIEGMAPQDALAFAVTAGALACTRPGAQPSLPQRRDVDALALGGK
ncbi:ribokinase [Hyphomonas adhaerens]|uniref:ribokinase n=1 Tax=Hyphomonas adhaerens TaxID=81029 RepID=UPI002355F03A|nr:ribokinase [Hyphomonas adhaerens]|tara:strand:+ start:26408 stop:27259 length:852 start_codon:yes stop_codon:yes gene_type:complete